MEGKIGSDPLQSELQEKCMTAAKVTLDISGNPM